MPGSSHHTAAWPRQLQAKKPTLQLTWLHVARTIFWTHCFISRYFPNQILNLTEDSRVELEKITFIILRYVNVQTPPHIFSVWKASWLQWKHHYLSRLAAECSRTGIRMGISTAESHLLEEKDNSGSVLLTHTKRNACPFHSSKLICRLVCPFKKGNSACLLQISTVFVVSECCLQVSHCIISCCHLSLHQKVECSPPWHPTLNKTLQRKACFYPQYHINTFQ